MALTAPVKNGELVQQTAQAQDSTTKKTKASNSMDKDSFLQLLVAQMKYQDPLEPTSNTEYIAQYAQFSELESMQNLSSNMDLQRGTALVGKEVVMETKNSSGDAITVEGRVDYVTSEGSKVFLSIDGNSYNLDDLVQVIDTEYSEAQGLVENFVNTINNLPNVSNLTTAFKDTVQGLVNVYNNMTAYQKSYLPEESTYKLTEYADRMKQLVAIEEASTPKADEDKE